MLQVQLAVGDDIAMFKSSPELSVSAKNAMIVPCRVITTSPARSFTVKSLN